MSVARQKGSGKLSASALVWGMVLVLTPAGWAQTLAKPVLNGVAAAAPQASSVAGGARSGTGGRGHVRDWAG